MSEIEELRIQVSVKTQEFERSLRRVAEAFALAKPEFDRFNASLRALADSVPEIPDNGPSPDWYGWQMIAEGLANRPSVPKM